MQNIKAKFHLSPTMKYCSHCTAFMKLAIAAQLFAKYTKFHQTMTSGLQFRLFQITNLMHNSFILQQYVCYTMILNMFRAARCSSSGGYCMAVYRG